MVVRLEHVNITVSDPDATAAFLADVFGWSVRWSGPAIHDGYSVHVGDASGYVALYRPGGDRVRGGAERYGAWGGLNHIGIVVDDLAKVEARVIASGHVPHNHADYEPGQRFYFDGPDGVEYEVVSYG
ncbi:VOC family protein [Puniceibacterium sediminis]|uniref:Catechol 2,3-dioxygenase n=1 Tax=Puniceibacterium sediminis TaxID=1608407 RepID=A0A238W583_9RHOB|nr:VOC family protein [Puniceibacterium sediminis]SNR41765.1 Catechol 2,3-dioxygenase [Puniceibacterium sediminis]